MDIDIKIKLPDADMKLLGLKAVQMIKKRTAEGKGVDGDFKKYSERWFARPAGGHTQAVMRKFISLGEDTMKWFRRDGGQDWITFNGYKKYKEVVYKDEYDGGKVNLRATGDMMDGFTVIATGDGVVTLGWIDMELAERAAFNELRGRSILGLTEAEVGELEEFAASRVEVS